MFLTQKYQPKKHCKKKKWSLKFLGSLYSYHSLLRHTFGWLCSEENSNDATNVKNVKQKLTMKFENLICDTEFF